MPFIPVKQIPVFILLLLSAVSSRAQATPYAAALHAIGWLQGKEAPGRIIDVAGADTTYTAAEGFMPEGSTCYFARDAGGARGAAIIMRYPNAEMAEAEMGDIKAAALKIFPDLIAYPADTCTGGLGCKKRVLITPPGKERMAVSFEQAEFPEAPPQERFRLSTEFVIIPTTE